SGEFLLWNVETKEKVATLGHPGRVWSEGRLLANGLFSPVGSLLASVALRGVELWDASEWTGTSPVTIQPKPANPDSVVLVALYNATDGPNWKDKTNWLSDRLIGEWQGVRTSASGRVTSLSLRSNRLSGVLPPELGSLPFLGSLYLDSNQLSGSIPKELGSLTNLTNLSLSNNQLTGAIPKELGSLTNLTGLYLAGNQLTGCIPAGLRKVANNDLDTLSLSDCGQAQTQAPTDFNGDGRTDFADFFKFVDAFGSTDARYDLDGSGTVDFVDFFKFVDAFDQPGQGTKLVALAREMLGLPAGPELRQNWPNPFNTETVLSWFLLEPGPARVEVFALTGQRLAVLRQGPQQAGYHHLHWDGRDDEGRPLASGVYLYRLVTTDAVMTRKLTLLR
ncbi:MAG: leucine-rich repeat domain-containing protein, partial [Gemmatimonadetes bacterium]|nr:leucine-rich repeat domain-containing protein [Gemmatimonadota bacterium]